MQIQPNVQVQHTLQRTTYKQVLVHSGTNLQVLQRVLALCATRLLSEARAQSALNVLVVKQHLQVCVGHECTWRLVRSARVRRLAFRGAADGTEDFVETLECRLGPDAEAAEMTTWLATKYESLSCQHCQGKYVEHTSMRERMGRMVESSPGARRRRLRRVTQMLLTPGTLRNARRTPLSSL